VHFAAPNLFSGVFYIITEPIPPPNLFSGVAPPNLFSDTFFIFKNLTGFGKHTLEMTFQERVFI
jgi:hypothetical protein